MIKLVLVSLKLVKTPSTMEELYVHVHQLHIMLNDIYTHAWLHSQHSIYVEYIPDLIVIFTDVLLYIIDTVP